MKKKSLFLLTLIILFCNIAIADIKDPYISQVSIVFSRLKSHNNFLEKFIATMPKGGNLHTHFTGSIYPWDLLRYGYEDRNKSAWCFERVGEHNRYTVKHSMHCDSASGTNLQNIFSNSILYLQILKSWSLLGYQPSYPTYAHNHFFSIFALATPITHYQKYRVRMLADLIKQAYHEKLHYLEIMVNPDISLPRDSSIAFAQLYLPHTIRDINSKSVQAMIKVLNKHGFIERVVRKNIINKTQSLLRQAKASLACSHNLKKNLCNVVVKFQYQGLRTLPLNETFATLYAGFLSVKLDPSHFVGVNLVGPEDNAQALKFYQQQMQMIHVLSKLYPNIPVSLHAGELTKNLVGVKNMKFHIYDALTVAGAARIGHGVDVWSEQKAGKNLFRLMKQSNTLIEINLSSNEAILGVCDGQTYCISPEYRGKFNSPFFSYLKMGVPIALSTDDQGILLNNLSEEYVKSVKRYPISYSTVKNIDRNSLSYSFLSGQSLWKTHYHGYPNWHYHEFVKPCANDNPYSKVTISSICQDYLDHNLKAKLQWQLEVTFAKFEKHYTSHSL